MIYYVCDTHGAEVRVPDDCTCLVHLGDAENSLITGGTIGFRKVLVRGNHDEKTDYLQYDLVLDAYLCNNVWFTHEPAFSIPLGAHWNVHGHMHEAVYEDYGYIEKPFHIRLYPRKLYSWDDIQRFITMAKGRLVESSKDRP
jgi:metallophosphoesterase superfamily enzyme